MQEAVESDVWAETMPAFAAAFQECQSGDLDYKTCKNLVSNMLADVAPGVLQDFLEVFDTCCETSVWATSARFTLTEYVPPHNSECCNSRSLHIMNVCLPQVLVGTRAPMVLYT